MTQEKETLLSTVEKVNRSVITWIEAVGVIGLLTMMVITCLDVLGSKLFLRPVFGSIDIVMLAQIVAVSFGAASALILGRHIQVEFFVVFLPKRAQAAVDVLVNALGLLLFVLVVWRLTVYGLYMQTGGEVSPTARIPLYPFAYGIAFACIPVCMVFLVELVSSVVRMTKK
jgi:TRAP-type C4-dicarboxylate transport system permease small subunit